MVSTESQSFTLKSSQISLSDSRGKQYEIVSVEPQRILVTPDVPVELRIIADDSPKWWGVKFFKYEIAPGVLGNTQSIELTRSMNEVLKRETGALSQ